jgi:signal transduction histidine kinase
VSAVQPSRLPWRRSLRARGVLVTLSLLVYVAAAGLHVADERTQINARVQALERLSRHDQALAVAAAGIGATLLDLDAVPGGEAAVTALNATQRQSIAAVTRHLEALEEFDPAHARLPRAVQRSVQALDAAGGPTPWQGLRDALGRAAADVEIRRHQVGDERDALHAQYRRGYDAVTVTTLLLSLIGLVVFGSIAAWFFTRLSGDIRRLEAHARKVVQGSRGSALPVERDDELGQLMHAVNRMASDLDAREREIEIEGQRRSHHDKMLAVAALAAGMAHEVNNPLTVIHGTAQMLKDEAALRQDTPSETRAETILEHARRAAQAARALADAAAPPSPLRDWFDLAALARRALSWMVYDRRYRFLAFDLQTPPELPAVHSAADVVQRVLMQMLALACEAQVQHPRGRDIPVQLALAQHGELIEVRLACAAVPDFTRDDVQRAVLVARAAWTTLGGELAFGQDDLGACHIKLVLPMQRDDKTPR